MYHMVKLLTKSVNDLQNDIHILEEKIENLTQLNIKLRTLLTDCVKSGILPYSMHYEAANLLFLDIPFKLKINLGDLSNVHS